jgi:hypothetical protein
MKKSGYDLLKRVKGEKFAQAVRDYHTGIFEIPDLIEKVRYAGPVATEDVLRWLYIESKTELEPVKIEKQNPFDLLTQAGYSRSFLVTSLEEQNSIMHYYRRGEELCTFNDDSRWQRLTVIHAVRDDAETVKYAPNGSPGREDAYGTSVISIQFRNGFISIKNRYNHTVGNPDNTFGSNPDNIIKGLTAALESEFKVSFALQIRNSSPENHVIVNGNLVYYYEEINGVYFGPKTWVKDGQLNVANSDYQVLADTILIDSRQKTAVSVIGHEDGLIEILERPEYQNAKWTIGKNEVTIGSMHLTLEA